jgi:hypothetical protein
MVDKLIVMAVITDEENAKKFTSMEHLAEF